MSKILESCRLICQEQGHNKFYELALLDNGDDTFSVSYKNGAIGSVGTPGFKIENVDLTKAQKKYASVLKEKTTKAPPYHVESRTSGTSDTMQQLHACQAPAVVAVAPAVSGYFPQLLNDITNKTSVLQDCLDSDDWIFQPKFDGKHMLLKVNVNGQVAINKKGLEIAVPAEYTSDLSKLTAVTLLDGESIGKTYWVFDILIAGGEDVRNKSYSARHHILSEMFRAIGTRFTSFKIAPIAVGYVEKQAMYDDLKIRNQEGLVIKRFDAPYTPGRPNSGGSQFKFKFLASVSCFVIRDNLKSSVGLGLLDSNTGDVVDVGNVTIPANKTKPATGALVEVRYLYAYRGGSLYQPVYLGERDDADVDSLEALKYKPESEDG